MQKLIDRVDIENGIEMSVIPEATHFMVKGGEMRQYLVNPKPKALKMYDIPKGANTFVFREFESHGASTEYGEVTFFNHKGHNLKTYKFY